MVSLILISVVSKSLVCFCHSVCFFSLLESAAHAVLCIHNFSCKSFSHGSFAAVSRIAYEPTQSKSLLTLGSNFHRHLIGGTTYTASFNFKRGLEVLKRFLEYFKGVLTDLLFDDSKCIIYDGLSNTLLAVIHYVVNKLSYELASVHRIRQYVSFGYTTSSWHCTSLLHQI